MRFLTDLLTDALHCSGTPTSIVWTDVALHRTVAQFGANDDVIAYAVTAISPFGYFPKQGTIGFWAAVTTNGYILSSGGSAAGDFRIESLSGVLKFSVWDGAQRSVTGTTSIADGAYRWIAISFGVNGMHVYINGIEEGTPLPLITQTRLANAVYAGANLVGTTSGFIGHLSDLRVSDVESDPMIRYGEDGAMALRIHSYGVDPRYDFDFEYLREGLWRSLKTRVLSDQPITVKKPHGDFYTGGLVLDNHDGLLTIEHRDSTYNLLADGITYDALLDEARKVRIRQGIDCYPNVSYGIAPTQVSTGAGPLTAPDVAGSLAFLTDGLYGESEYALAATAIADTNWTKWTNVPSGGQIILKLDLGTAKTVACAVLSLLSVGAANKLPATVLFEHSTDDATYYSCGSAFALSEYTDSDLGQQYLAWFTDLNKSAQYIRATITNIGETNTIAADEFAVYAGAAPALIDVETLNGYLGEAIDADNGEATITLNFLDLRKRERDNQWMELTPVYTNERPEHIIYHLLTDPAFWTGAAGAYDAPLTAQDIGWASTDNLSGFVIPTWQGQNGTIQDYIDQLAKVIGWVYDCDGDGKRQFWEPEYRRTTASTYLNLFGQRWGLRGTVKRHKTGDEIRNDIWVQGSPGWRLTPGYFNFYEAKHSLSIAKYGRRYARIIEPLAKTPDLQKRLALSILRDFAYARDALTVSAKGDFDIDRPKKICTFNEPIRAYLNRTDFFSVESCETEMRTAGRGEYRAELTAKQYIGGPPGAISGLKALNGLSGAIRLDWTANTELDIDGYIVYWSLWNANPALWSFTPRAKVTATTDTVTGLVDGTPYIFYVTAVNHDGTEGPRSVPSYHTPKDGGDPVELTVASQWRVDLDDTMSPTKEGSPQHLSVLLVLQLSHDIFPVKPDSYTVAIYGPSTVVSPLYVTEQADIVPTLINSTETIYRRYALADIPSATDCYGCAELHRVTINKIQYELGTPITGNTCHVQWPTYP
jgi:hypothetical protein